MSRPRILAASIALCQPWSALAGGIQTLEAVEVSATAEGLTGIAASSSEGTVTATQLENRPLLRPAEVLETVPGLIVTQHSGDGKANQYFLRGFNLDHGTDFATYLLGMPINLPTHAHGQGYTDLNFLIPELVSGIQYRKGPYAAEQGDFSSAGSAGIAYKRSLPANTAEIGIGGHGYLRGLAMGSSEVDAGTWLWALEGFHNDGPWKEPEDYRRGNFVLRFSQGREANGWSASLLGYDGKWNSTDQVPQRAIASGLMDRYGTLDPTTGGTTSRYAATADWVRTGDDSRSQANVWLTRYRLNLFSDFTYALESPTQGDQFEQADSRTAFGADVRHTLFHALAGHDSDTTLGLQLRQDRIHVGLYRTVARVRTDKLLADGSMGDATIREDAVRQSSLAVFLENRTQWLPWLRSIAGLRSDGYAFDVESKLAANSGQRRESIASPRLALVFGPWAASELYLNWGHGFHSNDARGATQKVDPADGVTPAAPVDPLVRTRGMEIG
ncbi:MAG: TonB-dependent receptor plug domain-containing protein, partial [Zoogloea sp.]|nr:TonB-dependent receptor plug domain-containing protein [Zoogloea sp.]